MIAQTAADLIDMGNLCLLQGKVALARWLYDESLSIWRALDDAPGIAHALERLRRLDRIGARYRGEAGHRSHGAELFGQRGERS
jgi:hypothetical protein